MSQRRFSPAPGREEALTSRPGLGAWGGWRSGRAKQFQSAVQELAELPVQEMRSEEHTSELQSRLHLVCRLLLEKKKNKHIYDIASRTQCSTSICSESCRRP